MTEKATPQPTVVRTSRGLSIAGRRLTLYSIMDYLQMFLLRENGAELETFVEDEDVRQWCAKQAGEHVPGLEDVRQMLSKIPGSMADVVIAERGERF